MNKKKVLLFSFAALLGGNTLMAQTGQWKLAGNALAGTEKLGSTNNFGVDFFTNNVKRMSLTNKGNLRFNSDQLSIQFPNPGSTPKPMMFLYESGSSNKARMIMAYSSGFPSFGLRTDGFNKFDFTDGINSALTVDLGVDFVGVGTFSPKTKLHVFNGASGATPFAPSTLTLESSGNNYMNILAPKASETGILFGHNLNNISGGIVYNSGNTNALQFRTDANITRMTLTKDGFLNVGPSANEDYMVQINHNGNLGLDLVGNGTDWEFFAANEGLQLFADGGVGGFHGLFDRTTGFYSVQSDERVKSNIKPMADVLEKISQLKPASFQYKYSKNKQQYDGFIAQQVVKIFPTLVTHSIDKQRKIDLYTMNYSGFGIIAIKGIQELMKINEEKDAKIDALQKQIDELKAIVLKGNQSSTSSNATINTSLTDASLEQNAPNPFASATTIRYALPQKFATAQILITDKSGKTIKQLNVSGAGKGVVNVEASALSAGTYNYSLIVDGKIISTKQMVVTK